MQNDLIKEATRQAEICNACRYCEGYCSVFPALHRERNFSLADITHLANLCHNCRGCYYACQYTAPHEFDLNLPKALADVRQDSWNTYAYPTRFASIFMAHGLAISAATVAAFALLFAAVVWLKPQDGEGFYAALSHSVMVAIFLPAFLFPFLSIAISLRRYWMATGGGSLRFQDIQKAFESVSKMQNLTGGHGDGCNFENEDEFSHARRYAHQAVMYGFLLCFASTSVGTILHYFFDKPAPYEFWTLPKLLGVPGGILMMIGCVMLAKLKISADRNLSNESAWGAEMAFIGLLFFIAATGLLLYMLRDTSLMQFMLIVHLGSVLSFFLLTPYTKMVHGFYRLTALIKEEQKLRLTSNS